MKLAYRAAFRFAWPRCASWVAISLMAFLSVAPARAQLQQRTFLDLDSALLVMEAAHEHAEANGWQVAIAIVDRAGELVAFRRMNGVQYGSIDIALQKAETAARFRRPTRVFADRLAGGALNTLDFPGALPMTGGYPITVNGDTIGALGVSGATGDQDEQIARAGAAMIGD